MFITPLSFRLFGENSINVHVQRLSNDFGFGPIVIGSTKSFQFAGPRRPKIESESGSFIPWHRPILLWCTPVYTTLDYPLEITLYVVGVDNVTHKRWRPSVQAVLASGIFIHGRSVGRNLIVCSGESVIAALPTRSYAWLKTDGGMANLELLGDRIHAHLRSRSGVVAATGLAAKILIVAGSVAAVVAELGGIPTSVGIGAAIAILFAGVFIGFSERNSFAEVDDARSALETARRIQARFDRRVADDRQVNQQAARMLQLYTAMNLMRDAVEAAIVGPQQDVIVSVTALLDAAERPLKLTLGFEMDHYWTLCIYVAELDATTQRIALRCVAHRRAKECPLAEARKWPEGIGIAGEVYSRNMEIIVPDLAAAELGTLYRIANPKPEDEERYRSIVGVPIKLGQEPKPWGVVIATTDNPEQFLPDEDDGVRAVEGARALAGMVALAVEAHRLKSAANHPQP